MYNTLADLVVVIHFAFIVFVIVGAFSIVIYKKMIWMHLPALIWGVAIEFLGLICPLTPLENYLRLKAGSASYAGSFIENYLVPFIYPDELTRELQWLLGVALVLVNFAIYAYVLRRWRSSRLQ